MRFVIPVITILSLIIELDSITLPEANNTSVYVDLVEDITGTFRYKKELSGSCPSAYSLIITPKKDFIRSYCFDGTKQYTFGTIKSVNDDYVLEMPSPGDTLGDKEYKVEFLKEGFKYNGDSVLIDCDVEDLNESKLLNLFGDFEEDDSEDNDTDSSSYSDKKDKDTKKKNSKDSKDKNNKNPNNKNPKDSKDKDSDGSDDKDNSDSPKNPKDSKDSPKKDLKDNKGPPNKNPKDDKGSPKKDPKDGKDSPKKDPKDDKDKDSDDSDDKKNEPKKDKKCHKYRYISFYSDGQYSITKCPDKNGTYTFEDGLYTVQNLKDKKVNLELNSGEGYKHSAEFEFGDKDHMTDLVSKRKLRRCKKEDV